MPNPVVIIQEVRSFKPLVEQNNPMKQLLSAANPGSSAGLCGHDQSSGEEERSRPCDRTSAP